MKYIYALLVMLLAFLIPQEYALAENICATQTGGDQIDLTQRNGKYITSLGELRVLVVFASFPDDNTSHSGWPAHAEPPVKANFIDANTTQQKTNYANLTHYYRIMSMGLYDMIGEVYYVETPQTKQWYDDNGYRRGAITQDVLENVIDPIVDFSLYDNWTRTSNYNHDNVPDNLVDMIFMIWRGDPFFSGASGEASLGGTNFLTDDGVWVKGGRPTGSGITMEYEYNWGSRDVFKISIHEFAHWLIGPHPYQQNNKIHRIWSMLGDRFADGDCANAFERHQLA